MGWTDKIRDRIIDWLGIDGRWNDAGERDRITSMAINSDYYHGFHRRPFKVRLNQPNDNLAVNYTKLLVNKSLAMLLGKGIEFDLEGEDETPEQEYIDKVWKANKKDILLQDVGQYAGMFGTAYIKIIPEALEDEDGDFVPRMVALNPLHWTVITEQEDIDKVIRYEGRFTIVGPNGKDTARKSIIEAQYSADGDIVAWVNEEYWFIAGMWQMMSEPVVFEYPFPPIIHWKNLPNAGEVYGMPDIDSNTIELQDRLNFVASNISKIIRYHAHPKTWGRNIGSGSTQSWGADQLVAFTGPDAHLANLEMTSDLASSVNFYGTLRQALFDTNQTVDLSTIKDKIGALTNFGLRVIYLDAEAKVNGKREVWGEALAELNRRLLRLGSEKFNVSGGVVVWPDVLPSNEAEKQLEDKFEIDYGIASKQSVSVQRGYDWQVEQERIADEQAQGDNVGAAILRAFNGGQ